MAKVSVIIPNYNHALFLKQRIDSVIGQTYQDFELIILDDCSTDNSKDVIASYSNHPKVSQIIYNSSNSGTPFLQWLKGIALAQGEFIWIAESDDFAEPNFLKETVNRIERDQQIGLVYTDSNIIRTGLKIDNFKHKNSNYLKATNWDEDHLVNGTKELELHLIENCTIYNVSAVLFRGEVLKSVIDEIVSFKFAGDWVCYMLIALKYNICYIAESLNNYRSHDQNLTKQSGVNYLAMLERITARHFIKNKLNSSQNHLFKKIQKINLLELRAIFGGLIRGKIPPVTFFRILKYYI